MSEYNIELLFKLPLYTTKDWKQVIKLLKKKNKHDLIKFIYNILKESYSGIIPFPKESCDFASDFGYMIFKELGYDTKVYRFYLDEKYEHNFLIVDNEIIDFTNKQFNKELPIEVTDKTILNYANAEENIFRNENLSHITFGWFVQMTREKQLVGLMNYVPFSYIITKMLYS